MNTPLLGAPRKEAIRDALRKAEIRFGRISHTNMTGDAITFAHLDNPADAGVAIEAIKALGWEDTRIENIHGMLAVETRIGGVETPIRR